MWLLVLRKNHARTQEIERLSQSKDTDFAFAFAFDGTESGVNFGMLVSSIE